MSKLNRSKLNILMGRWPKGTVCTANYLKDQGYSYELLDKYKKSKWIESVGRGAYKLWADDVDWTGAIFAIQERMHLPIHTGGKTSLQLMGYAHFIPVHLNEVFLFGEESIKLPTWIKKYDWKTKIFYTATNLFPKNFNVGISTFDFARRYSIKISSLERTAMEMLHLIPKKQSFDEALLLMETLYTLRPNIIQSLLENCSSIKVKRLFMYFAEHFEHAWVKKINLNKIDFGSGKRVIIKNGVLDKKYNITVPKNKEEVVF